jgi:hypothetical protein
MGMHAPTPWPGCVLQASSSSVGRGQLLACRHAIGWHEFIYECHCYIVIATNENIELIEQLPITDGLFEMLMPVTASMMGCAISASWHCDTVLTAGMCARKSEQSSPAFEIPPEGHHQC